MAAVPPPPTITVRGSKGSGRGRGLYALRAFQPGELIATFADPLLALPNGPSSQLVCNHCLAHNVPTRACTGCRAAVYCGPACQKANWALIHKQECKAFKKVRSRVHESWLPTPVRALVQILLRWGDAEVRAAFESLQGNVQDFKREDKIWKDLGLQAYAGLTYAGRDESDAELNLARDILCKIQTNSFDRTDVDTGQAGIFLHPTLSMANHSCVPNAKVSFVRRKAFLRAELPIKEGDELSISYVDYTKPKAYRQLGLALYHFQCACPRCKGDLSVYEVCQTSPVIPLNAFSLVPNLEKLRKPRIRLPAPKSAAQALKASIAEMYAACQTGPGQSTKAPSERLGQLRHQWEQCQPLIKAGMWATEPLALTVEHAVMYYTLAGSFAHALSVACFAALNCDPYKYPAPFEQWRLKGVMVIAKTLTNTAPPLAMEELAQRSHPRLMMILKQADQVSICQALALMVLKNGLMAHSGEWEIVELARSMLQDIQSLEGREKESALLHAWAETRDEAGTSFFKSQVLRPIEDLAAFAEEILVSDLQQAEPISEGD